MAKKMNKLQQRAYDEALAKIEEAARNNRTTLNLEKMELTALPPEIGKLTNLRDLDLNYSQLTTLPPEIGKLTKLERLYLCKNRLTKLPPEIGQLTKMQNLQLQNNQLTELPAELSKLTKLTTLYLGGNPLGSPSLGIVGQGTEAVLGYLREKAKEMNEEQQKAYDKALAMIEEAARDNSELLDFGGMGLTALPPEIGKLTNLQKLDLQSTQLTALPPEIFKLTNLEQLNLFTNQLTALPTEIGKLTNLQALDLGENQLTELPPEIGKLTNLQTLALDDNRLTALLSGIGKLTSLETLYLHNNQLTALPAEISQLKKLERLSLHGNDDLGIPPEVLGRKYNESGEPARPGDILEYYFRQLREAKRELREAKVLLVGQGGGGKTSLVKRLIDGKYDKDEPKTDGINIRDWGVDGKRREDGKDSKIKLNVWDFGGQEIMHATHQFFLTKRSLYVLVLDARKGENECNIQYWLKIIQSYGGDSPVLVVTNQCDQDYLELNENRLTKDYAPNIKGFFTTSCKSGKGIEQLKAAIEKEINEMPHVYDVLPKSYFDIKQELEKLAESKNFIDIGVYRELCRENTVTEENEQDLLLRFLHDLGNVLNFGDPEDPYQLRDTNILNPEWVTEGVYKILNNEELQKQKDKGVLRLNNIASILTDKKKYPNTTAQYGLKKFSCLCR